MFSRYNQCTLAENYKDLTAFMTPLRLLQAIIIPQGGTNSVGQFVRIVIIIFIGILDIVQPFLDDFGIKGFKDHYDN